MTVPLPPTVAARELDWEHRRTAATERLASTLGLMFGTIVAVAIVWALADVVLLVFAAILLACLLRGGADWLSERIGGTPGLWLAAILLLLFSTLGLTLYLRGPVIAQEVRLVYGELSEEMKSLWARLGAVEWIQPVVSRVQDFINDGMSRIAGIAAGVGTKTLGGLGSLVVVLVAGVYFAIDPVLYVKGVLRLMPRSWRPHGLEAMREIATTLRWWFIGQFVDMVAIGLLTGIGLYLLGVKLAVTLALIAALFNFVPYIGALAGAVPAILVALGQGPQTAAYVAILFVAVQTLEGNLIAPMIQKQTVEMAPVLTIMSQTVLGSLFGPLGLVLATPLTAAGVVAVRKVYIEDVLGDRGGEGASFGAKSG